MEPVVSDVRKMNALPEPVSINAANATTEEGMSLTIPFPPPLGGQAPFMPEPATYSTSKPGDESMASLVAFEGEITITDQDVLFGRGGLSNHHIGNLRYRDIISIHRQDYIRAPKIEKPNVARRIVKAIRTGLNPGRFLRKGKDGKWQQVSDKEAAWKASQALREKTRWSSMKQEKDGPNSPATATAAASDDTKALENTAAKRSAVDAGVWAALDTLYPSNKKVKTEEAPAAKPAELPIEFESAVAAPTDVTHIVVPSIAVLEASKVGANFALPLNMDPDSADFFPRDEDILFGRGGRTNNHPGNVRLREIVNKYRQAYNQARKVDKPKVSRLIVSALRKADPPSRFLRHNEETGRWENVGDKRASEKVSQTLREKDQEDLPKAKATARDGEAMPEAEEVGALLEMPTPLPSPVNVEQAVTI